MADIDFPASPTVGQKFTALTGAVYVWNGTAWEIGYYDSATQQLTTLADILSQIRTLLQDVDLGSGQYRYSTDSIVTNINQAMLDAYRIRPDLFLANRFIVPIYSVDFPEQPIVIEGQYVPTFIYYAVGLTQARDDEQTQDARAGTFLKVFQQTLINGGIA